MHAALRSPEQGNEFGATVQFQGVLHDLKNPTVNTYVEPVNTVIPRFNSVIALSHLHIQRQWILKHHPEPSNWGIIHFEIM